MGWAPERSLRFPGGALGCQTIWELGLAASGQALGTKWDSPPGGCLTQDTHLACWWVPRIHAGATHSLGSFGGPGSSRDLDGTAPSCSPLLPHQSGTPSLIPECKSPSQCPGESAVPRGLFRAQRETWYRNGQAPEPAPQATLTTAPSAKPQPDPNCLAVVRALLANAKAAAFRPSGLLSRAGCLPPSSPVMPDGGRGPGLRARSGQISGTPA